MKKNIFIILSILLTLFFSNSVKCQTIVCSNINVPLDCEDYTHSELGDIEVSEHTEISYYYFKLEQSTGNLTILNPQLWVHNQEPFLDGFKQLNDSLFETTSDEGVLNLLFGIDDNDRDNGKYRNMLLKYKYWTRWDPDPPSNWSTKTFKIQVGDLVISGNDHVCYSPNQTYTVSGYPGGSAFN
jgi:hypothetical protein